MAASALMVTLVLLLSLFTTIQSNKADKYSISRLSRNLSYARFSLQVGTNSCITSFECFAHLYISSYCFIPIPLLPPGCTGCAKVVVPVNSVNTKQEAGGTYIATIRQLMSRLGNEPNIARRGILIMFVVMTLRCW